MCFSARAYQDWRKYQREFQSDIDILTFVRLFGERGRDPKVKIPKGMERPFLEPTSDAGREIKAMIDAWTAQQRSATEAELFALRKRLADAERVLASGKPTKKATNDQRIATDKISKARTRLEDLARTEPKGRDDRIFPGVYSLVMVSEGGRRVVKPMRYQCRPCGKPAFYDTKYPGTYNARRDNLEGFWKGQFGISHGIMIATRFYENVERVEDGQPRNVVLEFAPEDGSDMLVACLWSHWTGPDGAELLSFAAITDEPPPEVAAAGHDRCIIPIKPEHVDAWLTPEGRPLADLYAILDDRHRPYYEHRLAA
jgi:putative SOS response-associated peptidase YedK